MRGRWKGRPVLADNYLRFKADLDDKGIIMSFSGRVSESVLFSLGEALRTQMRIDETDTRTEKRVFSVFVELVQNIIRYSADTLTADQPPVELSSGVISVGLDGSEFFVVCANTIRMADVQFLRERLDHLATLDRDQIRAYYRQKLKEPAEEQSKGASLGLVEIARRTSHPIEFDFAQIDDDTAFFALKARI